VSVLGMTPQERKREYEKVKGVKPEPQPQPEATPEPEPVAVFHPSQEEVEHIKRVTGIDVTKRDVKAVTQILGPSTPKPKEVVELAKGKPISQIKYEEALKLPVPIRQAREFGAGLIASGESIGYPIFNLMGVRTPRPGPTVTGGLIGKIWGSQELEESMQKGPFYSAGTIAGDIMLSWAIGEAASGAWSKITGSRIVRFSRPYKFYYEKIKLPIKTRWQLTKIKAEDWLARQRFPFISGRMSRKIVSTLQHKPSIITTAPDVEDFFWAKKAIPGFSEYWFNKAPITVISKKKIVQKFLVPTTRQGLNTAWRWSPQKETRYQLKIEEPKSIQKRASEWVSTKNLGKGTPSTPLKFSKPVEVSSGQLKLIMGAEQIQETVTKQLPTLTLRKTIIYKGERTATFSPFYRTVIRQTFKTAKKTVTPSVVLPNIGKTFAKTTTKELSKNIIKMFIGAVPKIVSSTKRSTKTKSKSKAKTIEEITPKPPKPRDIEKVISTPDVTQFEGVDEAIGEIAKTKPILNQRLNIPSPMPKFIDYILIKKKPDITDIKEITDTHKEISPPFKPPKASEIKLFKPKKRKKKGTPATLYGWVGLEVPVPSARQILKDLIGGKKK